LNKNICHQSIFYRAEFVKKEIGRYNINYRLCADWDFNLRCFAKTDFLYTNLIIVKFYAGGESTGNNVDEGFSRDFAANILKYFKISPFDPLVNNVDFFRFHEVLMIQKEENYLKYLIGKVKRKYF
jgi:hypothetical protein